MVGPQIFNNDDIIRFEPKKHRYLNKLDQDLTSVSRVISSVIIPFDREGVSFNMAKVMSRKEGINVKEAQKRILDGWNAKLDSSIIHGNWIHNDLERYQLTGEYDPKLKGVIEQLQPIFKNGHRFFMEARTYSLKYMSAGTSDLVVQRQRGIKSVFDFYDYKTNEAKGIQFDSINRKKVPPKHYNRFLLSPLEHMEDCNYNHYSMQLSLYAFMAELTWGLRIGKLAILYIDNDLKLNQYPVPYLKLEAKALLEYHANLKPLPQVNKSPLPKNDSVSIQEEDDW